MNQMASASQLIGGGVDSSPAPSPTGGGGTDPALPPLTREQAFAKRSELLADPNWRAGFEAGDADKRGEMDRILRSLTPSIHIGQNVHLTMTDEKEAARVRTENETFALAEAERTIDVIRRVADLPDNIADMIRTNTPVSAEEKRLAQQEKKRLMADREWVQKWLNGDRAARSRLAIVDVILARPTA